MEGLSLANDEDGLTFDIEGEQGNLEDVKLCMVGRLVIDKSILAHNMKERLATLSCLVMGVSIIEVA